jgi:hypothetical protein
MFDSASLSSASVETNPLPWMITLSKEHFDTGISNGSCLSENTDEP